MRIEKFFGSGHNNKVANTMGRPEGCEKMVVGTLHYTCCELWRHVQYINNDTAKYNILEAINNALKNPFQMTQSEYVEASAE